MTASFSDLSTFFAFTGLLPAPAAEAAEEMAPLGRREIGFRSTCGLAALVCSFLSASLRTGSGRLVATGGRWRASSTLRLFSSLALLAGVAFGLDLPGFPAAAVGAALDVATLPPIADRLLSCCCSTCSALLALPLTSLCSAALFFGVVGDDLFASVCCCCCAFFTIGLRSAIPLDVLLSWTFDRTEDEVEVREGGGLRVLFGAPLSTGVESSFFFSFVSSGLAESGVPVSVFFSTTSTASSRLFSLSTEGFLSACSDSLSEPMSEIESFFSSCCCSSFLLSSFFSDDTGRPPRIPFGLLSTFADATVVAVFALNCFSILPSSAELSITSDDDAFTASASLLSVGRIFILLSYSLLSFSSCLPLVSFAGSIGSGSILSVETDLRLFFVTNTCVERLALMDLTGHTGWRINSTFFIFSSPSRILYSGAEPGNRMRVMLSSGFAGVQTSSAQIEMRFCSGNAKSLPSFAANSRWSAAFHLAKKSRTSRESRAGLITYISSVPWPTLWYRLIGSESR
uniref:Putative secreted protein n=1 Tax=Anopheles darlingi TaxID=43151 RepID=A0A2M4D009_ANODA